ncbi:hypothetical protein F5B22DRAFT_629517 [Xylaria bambusicola]|uniref:uncharacterized protein n=1 Tax=Xylaria bambusicola TaxID=326684 RepID=UPI002007ACFB|nr:uncharacterized protein F5B22DRAFT_629517 [Xylaria bambusicola]KAI0503368.1 hypothetical protein F5B22DRAFT_629517 [Xylaria bambusicola]
MSRRAHHRSRSSIDRVLDLLSELDEDQMQALLREAESTVSGNIPVSKGIDFFERPGVTPSLAQSPPPQPPPPRRKFLTSLSPRKQTELRRRLSKRASTQQDQPTANSGNPDPIKSPKKTPRSYKRISRPIFPLPAPAATADLTELLAAYLLDASVTLPSASTPSTALKSPAPLRPPFLSYTEPENDGPELDLLEPAPARAPATLDIFSGPVKRPTRKISGIFEVLDDAGSLGHRGGF